MNQFSSKLNFCGSINQIFGIASFGTHRRPTENSIFLRKSTGTKCVTLPFVQIHLQIQGTKNVRKSLLGPTSGKPTMEFVTKNTWSKLSSILSEFLNIPEHWKYSVFFFFVSRQRGSLIIRHFILFIVIQTETRIGRRKKKTETSSIPEQAILFRVIFYRLCWERW